MSFVLGYFLDVEKSETERQYGTGLEKEKSNGLLRVMLLAAFVFGFASVTFGVVELSEVSEGFAAELGSNSYFFFLV